MFDHPNFKHYAFSEIPPNRDLFLIDVKDMAEFEREWLELYAGKECDPNYLVSYVAVRERFDEVLELSWYPNVNTRFHEVRVTLPKAAFVGCIGQCHLAAAFSVLPADSRSAQGGFAAVSMAFSATIRPSADCAITRPSA